MIEIIRTVVSNALPVCRRAVHSLATKKAALRAVLGAGALSLGGCSGFQSMEPKVGVLTQQQTVDSVDGYGLGKINEAEDRFSGYHVGVHPSLALPSHSLTSHRWCHKVSEHFIQCLLVEPEPGSDGESNSIGGIEYIISKNLFNTLAEEDRYGWHRHDSEVLFRQSGPVSDPIHERHAEVPETTAKIHSYAKLWRVRNRAVNNNGEGKTPRADLRNTMNLDFRNRFNHAQVTLKENREQVIAIHNKVHSSSVGRGWRVQQRDDYIREIANKRASQRIHEELGRDDSVEQVSRIVRRWP